MSAARGPTAKSGAPNLLLGDGLTTGLVPLVGCVSASEMGCCALPLIVEYFFCFFAVLSVFPLLFVSRKVSDFELEV